MPLGAFANSALADFKLGLTAAAEHGLDMPSGALPVACRATGGIIKPSAMDANWGVCRLHRRSHPSSFAELVAIPPGGYDDSNDCRDPWTIDPDPRPGAPWLGIEGNSSVLQSTSLTNNTWIADYTDKNKPCGGCPRLAPSTKEHVWWHPDFVFKEPQFAVRVRLKTLYPEERMMWDVIFAGKPGNQVTVPEDVPPSGGKLPVFEMFCPPLSSKSKFELRLTDPDEGSFDERLTLTPQAVKPWPKADKNKYSNNTTTPRLRTYTGENEANGPLKSEEAQAEEGPDSGEKDEFGQVKYMAMPFSPTMIALASFL